MKKEAIEKFKDESDIKKFLDNLIKFNNYSYNNQILIWIQKSDAKYVTSFKNYTKMGYKINKGAKGIKIVIPNFINLVKIKTNENSYDIKPYYLLSKEELEKYKNKDDDMITLYKQKLVGFKLGNVFDANETNMPLDIIEKELNPILNDSRAEEIINPFIKTIYNDGFKVRFQELKDDLKGFCNHKEKEIIIKKGIGTLMQLKVLIHEYAHALAHKNLENNHMDYEKHRDKYETEAESIAYTVSKFLGMNTSGYSLAYLYSWSKNKDFKEVDDSFSTIINYSKKIINNFQKFYNYKINKDNGIKI